MFPHQRSRLGLIAELIFLAGRGSSYQPEGKWPVEFKTLSSSSIQLELELLELELECAFCATEFRHKNDGWPTRIGFRRAPRLLVEHISNTPWSISA